jgi:hypothetical protein
MQTLNAFRSQRKPNNEDNQLGNAFLLLMSVVDSAVLMTDDRSMLVDMSWAYVKAYIERNPNMNYNFINLKDCLDEGNYSKSKTNYSYIILLIGLVQNIKKMIKFSPTLVSTVS